MRVTFDRGVDLWWYMKRVFPFPKKEPGYEVEVLRPNNTIQKSP